MRGVYNIRDVYLCIRHTNILCLYVIVKQIGTSTYMYNYLCMLFFVSSAFIPLPSLPPPFPPPPSPLTSPSSTTSSHYSSSSGIEPDVLECDHHTTNQTIYQIRR